MLEVAGGHFCLVDGTFWPDYSLKVFYQTLVDGQNLFDVAEERLDVFCSERALVWVSLLLSGLLENMLCVYNSNESYCAVCYIQQWIIDNIIWTLD